MDGRGSGEMEKVPGPKEAFKGLDEVKERYSVMVAQSLERRQPEQNAKASRH